MGGVFAMQATDGGAGGGWGRKKEGVDERWYRQRYLRRVQLL